MFELQVYTCTTKEEVDKLPNGYIRTSPEVKVTGDQLFEFKVYISLGGQMFELQVYTCTIIEEVEE